MVKTALDILKSAGVVSTNKVGNLAVVFLVPRLDTGVDGVRMIPQPEYRNAIEYLVEDFRKESANLGLEGVVTGIIIITGEVSQGTAKATSKCQKVFITRTIAPDRMLSIFRMKLFALEIAMSLFCTVKALQSSPRLSTGAVLKSEEGANLEDWSIQRYPRRFR